MDVMADVRAAEIGDPRRLAPVPGRLFLGLAEIRFVRWDAAAAAEHDARNPSDAGITGDMEQKAVDSIHVLRHLLEHEHVIGQVRLKRRSEQLAEHGHIEGGGLRFR